MLPDWISGRKRNLSIRIRYVVDVKTVESSHLPGFGCLLVTSDAEIANLMYWHVPRLDFREAHGPVYQKKICTCCLKLLSVAIKPVLVVCL